MAVWTNETLEMAIRAMRNGGTIRAVATSFNIPSAPYKKGFPELKQLTQNQGETLYLHQSRKKALEAMLRF